MLKLISSLPLIVLMGCVVYPPLTHADVQQVDLAKQRDLFNPTKERAGGGFKIAEAKQLLEFCIELNNQDDRLHFPTDKTYQADTGNWQIVFDSRDHSNASVQWNTSGEDQVHNPRTNGIAPFNNAWLLLKNKDNPKQFAIAIRGTVGEKTSILNDALVTTTPAKYGIHYPRNHPLSVVFAATPNAELHLGFANAAFVLLFDQNAGILKKLRDFKNAIPADAQLFITGHSQGAAIATLVHSFLYYALTDSADGYQLKPLQLGEGNGIQLKSYVFAQPKPGNLQYAEDLAKIADDQLYVINNDLDTVPQVPLSIQTPTEAIRAAVGDLAGTGNVFQQLELSKLNLMVDAIIAARALVAAKGTERIARLLEEKQVKLDLSYFKDTPIQPLKASSQNYSLAGELIPLFGSVKGGCLYPIQNKPDALLQHHATSYRLLLRDQIEGIKTAGCTK